MKLIKLKSLINPFRNIFFIFFIFALFLGQTFDLNASDHRLAGYILLQVEAKGEAWYVNPLDSSRYYLGTPDDAFAIMTNFWFRNKD